MDEYYSEMDRKFESVVPDISEIGISGNPSRQPIQELKSKIFHGASKVELGFSGQEKTSSQSPGPESIGRTEREEVRELALLNNVQLSTHAAINIMGLTGLRNGKFDDGEQRKTMDEIKKAIEFAADASTGGAVVFHIGEIPRGMASKFKGEFKMHDKEVGNETHYLVDPEKNAIVEEVREDSVIYRPVPKEENGKIKYIQTADGEDYIDPITDAKVPVFDYDKVKGEIITEKITFSKFKNEQLEKNKIAWAGKGEEEQHKEVVKAFYREQQLAKISHDLGQSREYMKHYSDGVEKRDKIIKALNFYKDLKNKMPEQEWWKVQTKGREMEFVPPDTLDPIEYLTEQLHNNERQIAYGREIFLSGMRQAKEAKDRISNVELAEDFVEERSSQAMADLGMYAYEKYKKQIEKQEKAGRFDIANKLKANPLYVAPEAWLPEQYGSHPDELKRLLTDARKKMTDTLIQKQGKSQEEAKKIAEQSIKATVDMGHMNQWRKYYQGNPDNFDKWLLDKFEGLAKEGYIGHIHLTDNFGYHDEHLSVGEGNAPIKEFVKRMKKHGVSDIIVEVGSFNANTALSDAWAHLSSPVHRLHMKGGVDTWTDFKGSYFGKGYSPNFIAGRYATSNEFRGYQGGVMYSGLGLDEGYDGGGE